MRLGILLVLALIALPLAAAEPDARPLCDGEPLVDVERCYMGAAVYTCGSDDHLAGFGCFAL